MTAPRMTRRKATLPSHRSPPSRDPARLVAPQPSPEANIKQSFDPLSRLPNSLQYYPTGQPSQLLSPKSTIAPVCLEANSP